MYMFLPFYGCAGANSGLADDQSRSVQVYKSICRQNSLTTDINYVQNRTVQFVYYYVQTLTMSMQRLQ